MVTRVQKWGNSLGLRIPRSFAVEARLAEGTAVDVTLEDDRLIVRPVDRPRYRLGDLLKKIDRRKIHSEVKTGRATGREVW